MEGVGGVGAETAAAVPPPRRAARGGPDSRSKQLTLLACIVGSSMAFLDGTLVNVALPAIRADLHAGLAAQQWVVDAYLLTLGSFTLVGGSLGDLFGRRLIFAIGVAGFGLCSLLCAAAPSTDLLIGARALQGVLGALLVPSTLALIMDTFSERELATAIGSWTAWTGIATVFGPVLGGVLVDAGSWRYVFIINAPLALATLWLLRAAPAGERRAGTRVDWLGACLCALALGGPIFALIEQPRSGWDSPTVAIPLAAGLAAMAAFVAWERRAAEPMIPHGLLRSRNFRVGNLSTLCLYGALSAATFFLIVFLQQVGGYSALAAGAALLPLSFASFLLARRFGSLADRHGPRYFMGAGPIVVGAGLLMLLPIGARPDYWTQILPGMCVFGLGLSITVAPLTAAVLGSAGSEHGGVASGFNNAVARVAGLIAIAAVGTVVAGQFASRLDNDLSGTANGARANSALSAAKMRPFVIDASGFPARERPRAAAAMVQASVSAVRVSIAISAGLAMLSGLLSLVGVRNPRTAVRARGCPGGALYGASQDIARIPAPGSARPVPG